MNEEKIYQFNEYVLSYDKGLGDRSCLTISKAQNDSLYVMASLCDGSADVISEMLDSLQSEINKLKEINEEHRKINGDLRKENQKLVKVIEDIDKYIHIFKIEDIGEKTMLILNDILLIKNGLGKDVVRLNKLTELKGGNND